MNKPNRCLYIPLFLFFFIITCIALFIDNSNNWFAILTGIGCGGIVSVIVAWLIDIVNCREQSIKQKKLATFALNNFRVAVCNYLETFADLCIDADPKLEKQEHTFEEWLQIYVLKLKAGAAVRRPWIVDAIERVETTYRTFESNIYWLVDGEIITIDEYKKIKMFYRAIWSSKIYYLMKEREPNPDIIMEVNTHIAAQMKLIDNYSDLLDVAYSGDGDLSDKENTVNEMDYLQ